MKGFIEVTDSYIKKKILINIDHIQAVTCHRIFFDSYDYDEHKQDSLLCVEGYEEICEKIRKSVRDKG